ncbi:MAG TPA: HD domain-containing phosphohydrolase [Solirubrobacterales bacterium]|nr:HD domain-containing phosphohydrolase [Solirubrobacterales bacterium]
MARAIEWLRLEATGVIGPRGWRSLLAPLVFVAAAVALLVYDHVNERIPALIFWLALGLVVTVFARTLETNRRQSLALERRDLEAFSDRVTGLPNRHTLHAHVEAALAAPLEASRVLVLLEVEELQAYGDSHGYAAAEELLGKIARHLTVDVEPLGGAVYRFDERRFAVLVPAGQQQLGEVVLLATASLRAEDQDTPIGRTYGEVAIPREAGDAETAFQVACQRLAVHKQGHQHSARRQAHAVLVAALSAHRSELRDHLRTVAYRAIELGRQLGLSREEIDDVALAAELQDVGLLAVPEAILEKEGPLDEAETAMLHRHPLEGERMIAAAPDLAPVARLVRSSYERCDGSGYPDGLTIDAIPPGSRIIAVAVAYAALTSNRPYREALSSTEALAELRRCAGTQFDPQVVEALAADLVAEAAPASKPVSIVG